jgi:hypothetical protein
MAETVTYPNEGYGIMPNDAFNKYIRFQNQRRASTGSGASPSDQKAFWEGTMDSVVKNSATRAAQNLDKRRLDATINYQNRQLEQADDARKSQMISGLATLPMTYLMYDALGIGRTGKDGKPTGPSTLEKIGSGAWGYGKKLYNTAFGVPPPEGPGGVTGGEAPINTVNTTLNGIDTTVGSGENPYAQDYGGYNMSPLVNVNPNIDYGNTYGPESLSGTFDASTTPGTGVGVENSSFASFDSYDIFGLAGIEP